MLPSASGWVGGLRSDCELVLLGTEPFREPELSVQPQGCGSPPLSAAHPPKWAPGRAWGGICHTLSWFSAFIQHCNSVPHTKETFHWYSGLIYQLCTVSCGFQGKGPFHA